jgi:ribosome recycling factor
MRELAEHEKVSLREILQMETNGLAKLKASKKMIDDEELAKQAESAILAAEGRIKGIQQFLNENNIVTAQNREVH